MFEQFRANEPELSRIQSLIASRDLKTAAVALNALQKTSPNDPRVYSIGADLALAANNPTAAIDAVSRASALNTSWVHPRFQRAQALTVQGKLQEALDECRQIAQAAPRYLPAVELAATLYRRLGDGAAAEGLLRAAQKANPTEPGVDFLLAQTISATAPDEAIALLEKVLAAQPANTSAMIQLAELHTARGDSKRALKLAADALAIAPNDEYVVYHSARARGEQPDRIPASIVRALYADYAAFFDRQVLKILQYRLPELFATKIRDRFPGLNINLLDLGCGTGLLGAALGRINGYFVGVDVSKEMVEQAERRDVYHRLHLVDLGEALAATDANEYEVIVATDVLIYVGKLEQFIADAARVLRPSGALYFSCEAATEDEGDVFLRSTHRFAHSKHYVQRLCESNGLKLAEIEDVVVRQEGGQPIHGFMVCALKSQAI